MCIHKHTYANTHINTDAHTHTHTHTSAHIFYDNYVSDRASFADDLIEKRKCIMLKSFKKSVSKRE